MEARLGEEGPCECRERVTRAGQTLSGLKLSDRKGAYISPTAMVSACS